MSLQQFLQYVISGGGAVAVVSFIAERIAWFQAQTANAKQWLAFGASALIAVSSYAALQYVPASVFNLLNPYFVIVAGIFSVYFISQVFHFADKTTK